MTTSTKRRLLFAVLLLSAIPVCFSQQAPSGEVDFSFSSSNAPAVYDLTGLSTLSQDIQGVGGTTVPLSIGVSLIQNPRGVIKGSGVTLVTLGSGTTASTFAGFYNANGRITSLADGTRRLNLNVHAHNTDIVAGVRSSFNVSVHYVLDVTPAGFSGSARGSAQFSGLGGGRIDSGVEAPLPIGFDGNPTGMDGSWSVQMNIVPLGKLSGTGTVTVLNSVVGPLQMRISGRFDQTTGLSIVNLNGIKGAQGNNLHMEFFMDTNNVPTLSSMHGRIMGQQVIQ
jgi:hypothetical protein